MVRAGSEGQQQTDVSHKGIGPGVLIIALTKRVGDMMPTGPTHQVEVVSFSGIPWIEVDNEEDLARARTETILQILAE